MVGLNSAQHNKRVCIYHVCGQSLCPHKHAKQVQQPLLSLQSADYVVAMHHNVDVALQPCCCFSTILLVLQPDHNVQLFLQDAGTRTSWIDVNCLFRLHFKGSSLLPTGSVVQVETKVSSTLGRQTQHICDVSFRQHMLAFSLCYWNYVCRSAASA